MEALAAHILLSRTPRVGPVAFHKLLAKCGSAVAALDYLRREKGIEPPPESLAAREMKAAASAGARIMTSSDADYPELLRQLPDRPPLLYVLGDPAALSARAIAMVGSRNASLNSKNFARRLAADLVRKGYAVVSGMAIGIDTCALQGALAAEGTAIAVLAGGVDVIYPESNAELYRRIIDSGGAVASEMPMGEPPAAQLFPRRNRIVSGLGLGAVIVEASLKSGSLITARFAAAQGREVFAVPNHPLDPRSAGANNLIKEGAQLVESAEDVDAVFAARSPGYAPLSPEVFALNEAAEEVDPAPAADRILELLSSVPVALNDLLRAMGGFSHSAVSSALLDLELSGRIFWAPQGGIVRIM